MHRELKRRPSDYPQFAFRVKKEKKIEIMALVEKVHKLVNGDLAEEEKRIPKNTIIVEALISGLKTLRKIGKL